MKKFKLVLGLFMVMSLILAACTNTSSLNRTDTVNDNGVIGSTNDDVYGDVNETQTMPNGELAETVIIPDTGSIATVEPTNDGDESQEIPQTGTAVDAGRLSYLMDYQIVSMDNEEVGQIVDFVINLDKQKIEYALVNIGGFLGLGAKEVAIPFSQLNLSTMEDGTLLEAGQETVFTFPGDVERFEDAPEFNRDSVPGLENTDMEANENWDLDFSEFWQGDDAADDMNTEMNAAANQNLKGVILASDLLRSVILDDNGNYVDTDDANDVDDVDDVDDVNDTDDVDDVDDADDVDDTDYADYTNNGEVIGLLIDIIVDPQSGQIQYLVVELNNANNMGYQWTPVPLSAPYAPYAYYNNDIALVIPADVLGSAPVFDRAQFPVTTETGWNQEIDSYWNIQ